MTRVLATTPVLIVRDVEQVARWYQTTLGFVARIHPAEGPASFAILTRDGVEIMLTRCGPLGLPWVVGPRDWTVYLRVDDLDLAVEQLRGRASFTGPVDKDYGCREVEVRDPAGHVLVLSQRLAPAR